MPFGLCESFAECSSDAGSASAAPAAAAFEVLVDAVLLSQPFALAGMAGEHLQLELERGRDVEDEFRLDRAAEPVETFKCIDEIQVRDMVGRRGRLPLLRLVVWHAGVEAGVPDESRGDFVVGHVIDRRSSHHDVGPSTADDFGDSATSVVVVRDAQVTELKTDVVGTDVVGGGFGFGSAHGRDFFRGEFRRAAISRSHRGGRNVAATLLEQRQRAGTLELNVIGVCVNREDSWSGNAAVHCNLAFRQFSLPPVSTW